LSWLFAQLYERSSRRADASAIAAWREELLAEVCGEVVEIGAGNGLNLRHYTADVTRLVLTEPSPHMRAKLRRRLRVPKDAEVELCEGYAESIPLADSSMDAVVCTLVLCSVRDTAVALREARRVLRPGGQLLFLEHVLSDDPGIARWQRRAAPLWRCIADGCHPARDTLGAIEAAGFQVQGLRRDLMPGVTGRFAPIVRGAATLPASG
jgi:ubiquinone/menaquinone biosynthesis C-methylase UbiE